MLVTEEIMLHGPQIVEIIAIIIILVVKEVGGKFAPEGVEGSKLVVLILIRRVLLRWLRCTGTCSPLCSMTEIIAAARKVWTVVAADTGIKICCPSLPPGIVICKPFARIGQNCPGFPYLPEPGPRIRVRGIFVGMAGKGTLAVSPFKLSRARVGTATEDLIVVSARHVCKNLFTVKFANADFDHSEVAGHANQTDAIYIPTRRVLQPEVYPPQKIMSAPPPPPPPGFEGVFPPREKTGTMTSLMQRAKSTAKSTAATAMDQAKELDSNLQLSSSAKGAATAVFCSIKDGTTRGAQSARAGVAQKVQQMSPDERERWANGAITVLTLASALGGPKTSILAGATAMALGQMDLAGDDGADARGSHPVSTSTAGGSVQDEAAGGTVGPDNILTLEVVAAEDAGSVMRVHVVDVGDFEVEVPPGVCRGDRFPFEVERPAIQSIPMGLPVRPEDYAAGPRMPPMPPLPGSQVMNAGAPPVDKRTMQIPGTSVVGEMREMASNVREIGGLARDLGMTPQQAMHGMRQGQALARDLGVSQTDAVRMGVSAARMVNQARK